MELCIACVEKIPDENSAQRRLLKESARKQRTSLRGSHQSQRTLAAFSLQLVKNQTITFNKLIYTEVYKTVHKKFKRN